MDTTLGDDVTCTAQTRDTLWGNDHFCTHNKGHTEDHECLCGYTWTTHG